MFGTKSVKLVAGLLALAIVATLGGCSKSVVGKWTDEKEGAIMEFKSDGTGTVSPKGTSMSIGFTWKTDGNKLTISSEVLGKKVENTGEFSISGSTMTLKAKDGDKTLKRVD